MLIYPHACIKKKKKKYLPYNTDLKSLALCSEQHSFGKTDSNINAA